MITFKDEREAELWRSVYAPLVATLRKCAPDDSMNARTMLAGEYADAAVLEYRMRCGHTDTKPNIHPGFFWCDPSFKCWASAEPCLKVAKCQPEVPR